jgi:hypothetical protein
MNPIVWRVIILTPAALLSMYKQSWDVDNPVVLNKCLLSSQGTETKTSGMQVCLEDTGLSESLYSDSNGDGRL